MTTQGNTRYLYKNLGTCYSTNGYSSYNLYILIKQYLRTETHSSSSSSSTYSYWETYQIGFSSNTTSFSLIPYIRG